MPYFQQDLAEYDQIRIIPGTQKNRVLRTRPYDNYGSAQNLFISQEPLETELKIKQERDSEFVVMLQSNLKKEIELLQNSGSPLLSTKDESFLKYNIYVKEIIFVGYYSNIYIASHRDYPQYPLIARVFGPKANIDPHKSKYLRLLKHLGKRSPWIIATWGIYYDFNQRLVLFQEFAIHGNLMEYIRSNNVFVSELQLLEWAHNIYKGMDFLGSIGLCHRSIHPKHILLTPGDSGDRVMAKLSSFRDAIIYYDIYTQNINYQRCRPLSLRCQGNFQTPETYGLENEEFDPLAADVWSYGATLFYAGTKTYPYNYKRPARDLDGEIQIMINSRENLTSEAKKWFSGLLRTDVTKRTTFDQIASYPWFQMKSKIN